MKVLQTIAGKVELILNPPKPVEKPPPSADDVDLDTLLASLESPAPKAAEKSAAQSEMDKELEALLASFETK
jgi:hypothetical protein